MMFMLQCIFCLIGTASMLRLQNRVTKTVSDFLQLNAIAVVGAWCAVRVGGAVRWTIS